MRAREVVGRAGISEARGYDQDTSAQQMGHFLRQTRDHPCLTPVRHSDCTYVSRMSWRGLLAVCATPLAEPFVVSVIQVEETSELLG